MVGRFARSARAAGGPAGGWRWFVPILPGATARDRALGCAGAVVGIALSGLVAALVHGQAALAVPWLVAPMGASAVLLFAVPASPMAQPWPIIGGNTISALIGFALGEAFGHGTLVCGLAVGLAIAAMSVTRSLHPPGGAAALTGVLGGGLVSSAGWWFPVAPVALDAVVLTAAGWAFHRWASRHPYPHRHATPAVTRDPAPTRRVGVQDEDLDAVLAEVGEAFDIEREDLRLLLARIEGRVLARERADLTCAEIMSRDVIAVRADDDHAVARRLLLESGVRLLPVLDAAGRPIGGVGLRELARPARAVADVMTAPLTVAPGDPAVSLVGALTDGHRHAAMVVDPASARLLGLVTQADLLAALARRSVDRVLI
jgi:CBS domain-containing membrane protein